MLRGVSADVIPWRFRPNEDVHLDLNSRITVYSAEGHSMHLAFVHPTECRSTGFAEAQAPSGC